MSTAYSDLLITAKSAKPYLLAFLLCNLATCASRVACVCEAPRISCMLGQTRPRSDPVAYQSSLTAPTITDLRGLEFCCSFGPSLDSTLLSRELASPPLELAGGISRCRNADMLALALLVDLDSHPPDFLVGCGGGIDWVDDAVVGLAEGGAEVEATLDDELIAQPGRLCRSDERGSDEQNMYAGWLVLSWAILEWLCWSVGCGGQEGTGVVVNSGQGGISNVAKVSALVVVAGTTTEQR